SQWKTRDSLPRPARHWSSKPRPPKYWVSSTAHLVSSHRYLTRCWNGRPACAKPDTVCSQHITGTVFGGSQPLDFRWTLLGHYRGSGIRHPIRYSAASRAPSKRYRWRTYRKSRLTPPCSILTRGCGVLVRVSACRCSKKVTLSAP